MASGGKRRVKGDFAFRRILNRLPEAMRSEAVELLDDIGSEILRAQQAAVPVRSGRLRGSLTKRLYAKSMRVRAGIIGKRLNEKLAYRLPIEFGQSAKVRIARRRKPLGGTSIYNIRLPRVVARPFAFTERAMKARRGSGPRISAFWERTLAKAAQGVTDA